MSAYVLLLFLSYGEGGSNTAIDFDDARLCEAAGQAAQNITRDLFGNRLLYVCIARNPTPEKKR